MDREVKKVADEVKAESARPAVSARLEDGGIAEMVYDAAANRTAFCVFREGQRTFEPDVVVGGRRLVPYSPSNNLLRNEVVLLPSGPEEYGSAEALVAEIRAFIHRYVHVTPLYEEVAAYYVLLSWVYDAFNELPYLRLRGDPGCGKTRFLLTVGSLCYKPIFASGASTVSPLFRMLDAFRGTLIIDEGDFRFSDERAEIVKILNNGNARGFPVLRSEAAGPNQKEYNPTAYAVFGPKLVATRGFFQDRALESRCLTEEMGQLPLRTDVPINLPAAYKEEALGLRNMLLLFRFRGLATAPVPDESLVDRTIEPRLNQVFVPLLSVVDDAKARESLRDLARRYNREMVADRGHGMEAQILAVIYDLLAQERPFTVKDITTWFQDRYGEEYDRKVTAKWIGAVMRKKLHLRTVKSHGVYVIAPEESPRLKQLFERYGVNEGAAAEPAGGEPAEEPAPG